jgi:hypothetical protein
MKWLMSLIVGVCLYLPTLSYTQVIQQHNISDDGYARVPLQFAFPYYGRVFTESYMFSNGVVGFLNPDYNSWCCTGFDLRTSNGTPFNFAIMPLQTDLVNYGQGRFLTEGTPQYQRYAWENISEYGVPGNLNTFGVEIRPSGYIGIHYEKVNISPWRPVTRGMTGDTTLGEYTQYYHGPGYSSNENVLDTTQSTGGNLCVVDPLSSPSCPGYQAAFLVQQCSINPLYDSSCPGYTEAYYAQQCTLNALYDVNCPGYGVAYLRQQCSLSALYSPSCPGYTEAYFTQQCNANQLYSRDCPGYAQAYALANVVPATSTNTVVSTPQVQVSSTGTVSVETPVVADPVVNAAIASPSVTSVTSVTNTARTTESVATSNTATTSAATTEEKKESSTTSSSKPAASTNSNRRQIARDTVSKNEAGVAAASAPVLVDRPMQVQQLQIVDMLYLKMVKKPIQDNNKSYYNLIMNSQHKHEEMVDGQYK